MGVEGLSEKEKHGKKLTLMDNSVVTAREGRGGGEEGLGG